MHKKQIHPKHTSSAFFQFGIPSTSIHFTNVRATLRKRNPTVSISVRRDQNTYHADGKGTTPMESVGTKGKVRAHSHPSSHLTPKEVASAKHGRAAARTAHVSQTTINKPSSTRKSPLVFGLLNRICPSFGCCGSVGFFRKRPLAGNPFPFFPPLNVLLSSSFR